jgi:hypothetical protein
LGIQLLRPGDQSPVTRHLVMLDGLSGGDETGGKRRAMSEILNAP